MKYVGIVGHEAAKFLPEQEKVARRIIRKLLTPQGSVGVSGACPLGGIDVWAKEEADRMKRRFIEFPPKEYNWTNGFKPRNIQIAERSDIVHVIVVKSLPIGYSGRRFNYCYHCSSYSHVKSGGCWTAIHAKALGKKAQWHIIRGPEDIDETLSDE
jgi:hypothetical protein